MENKEFNLSEHQRYVNTNSIHMGKNRANKSQDQQKIIRVKDVKEFIKLSESKKFKCNISIGFDDDIQEVILVRDLLKLAGKDLNQNKCEVNSPQNPKRKPKLVNDRILSEDVQPEQGVKDDYRYKEGVWDKQTVDEVLDCLNHEESVTEDKDGNI